MECVSCYLRYSFVSEGLIPAIKYGGGRSKSWRFPRVIFPWSPWMVFGNKGFKWRFMLFYRVSYVSVKWRFYFERGAYLAQELTHKGIRQGKPDHLSIHTVWLVENSGGLRKITPPKTCLTQNSPITMLLFPKSNYLFSTHTLKTLLRGLKKGGRRQIADEQNHTNEPQDYYDFRRISPGL